MELLAEAISIETEKPFPVPVIYDLIKE